MDALLQLEARLGDGMSEAEARRDGWPHIHWAV